MIADDIHDIREGMRKLAQAKVLAEAEAARRAEADVKPADLPTPKPLFSESAPPFRGFFVSEDGDIVPFDMPPEQAAIFGTPPGGATTVKAFMGGYSVSNERAPNAPEDWADWIDTQEGNMSAMGAKMLKDERTVQAVNCASNRFTFWGYRGEDPDGA